MASMEGLVGGVEDPGVAMVFNGEVAAFGPGAAMTPAAVPALRLCAIGPRTTVIASGAQLALATIATDATGGFEKCTRTHCVTLPIAAAVESTPLACSIPERDEIQALAARGTADGEWTVAAAVSATGRLSMTRFPAVGPTSEGKWEESAGKAVSCVALESCGESGPASVSLDATASTVLTTHFFSRKLTWCREGKPVREVYTMQHPNACCFTTGLDAGGNTSAVVEGEYLSLWDLRVSERDGCVARENMRGGTLYCVGSSGDVVTVAGSANLMNIYDLRSSQATARWAVPSKFEVSGTAFNAATETCYAVGLDHEVLSSKWAVYQQFRARAKGAAKRDKGAAGPASEMKRRRGGGGATRHVPIPGTETAPATGESKESGEGKLSKNHHTGFRGDSRWVGIDLWRDPAGPDDDVLFTLSESAKLYATLRPSRLGGV